MCECNKKVKVKILNKSDNPGLPVYAHHGDSGMDVRANESVFIPFEKTKVIGTGLHFSLPEGYELQVRTRSGLGAKGVFVGNSPGTLDQKYTGELKIIINNFSYMGDQKEGFLYGFQVNKGDRIAQIVLQQVPKIEWEEVQTEEELGNTVRGSQGFGSTGVE